jgi:streptogramin lyase
VPQANAVSASHNVFGAFSFATDGIGDTFSTMDGSPSGGAISEIPSGAANFSNSSWFVPSVPASVTNNLVPDGVAAYGTSASNETVAFTSQNQSVVGIYSPVNPESSFMYVTEPGDCTGITYDASGNLWLFCNVNGQASIDKLVITSAWNLFYNPNAMADGAVSSLVTIAGGAQGATYTATCTGQLTCPSGSFSGPTFNVVGQEVAVSSTVTSTGTVTVSDGSRSVTINLETTSEYD